MADRKYYVTCDIGCKYESMTREQILTAITQAVNAGTVGDIDTGFVTTIKTINGTALKFFVGTQAEYEALTDEEKSGLFAIITNDTSKEALQNALAELQTNYDALTKNLADGSFVVAKATNADHATTADSATKATNAGYATSAGSASSATKATNDSAGNKIVDTYVKKQITTFDEIPTNGVPWAPVDGKIYIISTKRDDSHFYTYVLYYFGNNLYMRSSADEEGNYFYALSNALNRKLYFKDKDNNGRTPTGTTTICEL